ncbi:transient receptor potential cation channel subfamily A member 1-like [Dendronephthya gigantea]|uniref:transient receptor potential cation channel subfamily A member 1-like n=1 Tax=Dendronephthya gigantea TaxID=151771 RepID=UPI00106927E4|nr:transient receptor potential cation channel subfamily A member 1-like [Dendronephthya gigantea]
MSKVFELVRKTASRVYRSRKYEAEESHQLEDQEIVKYSSSCYNLYQACIVGDIGAVNYYISVRLKDVNEPDKNGSTALFYSIQKNHVVLVKDLIKAGADVNLVASLEEGIMVTPVHIAAKYNRCECLKILLENGADANIGDSFGQTPLHTAARRKLNEMVKILIVDGKANVNSADHDMVTSLHLTATPGNDCERPTVVKTLLDCGANPFCQDNEGSSVFHEAAENGVDDVLEILFEYGGFHKGSYLGVADVLNKPRNDGCNCLHLAVKNGHEKVVQMFIDNKANVNQKSGNGDTPLHIACARGHLNTCKILLENGADICSTDSSNMLPIHRAASKGHVECLEYLINKGRNIDASHYCGSALLAASRCMQHEAVKYLLDAGASVTERNQMMDTCLHVAVGKGDIRTVKVIMEKCSDSLMELRDKNERTALHIAAANGNVEVMNILLSYKPDVVAIDDRGKCPLHIAAENNNLDCARILIEADKDCVNYTDFMWRTPLHLASVYSRDKKLIQLLLENGADVNARDDRRWTPLLYVAAAGCPCCTKILVENGAKLNEWDKNRMTPLSLAASRNKVNAVKALLDHGADVTILNGDGLSCMDIALNNRFHDVCMVIATSDKWKEALVSCATVENCLDVSPEVAKVILDRCIETSGREIDKDYKVTYRFDLLDPDPDEKLTYYGPLVMKKSRRNELLIHPLTKKLLHVNWKNGVRYIYYTEMFLLALALVFLTLFMFWVRKLIGECYEKIKAQANDTSFTPSDLPQAYFTNGSFCAEKIDDYHPIFMFASRSVFSFYFVFCLLKELNQLRLERFEYFREITNYLDLAVSILFLLFLDIPSCDPIPFERLKFGTVGLFAYYFLMFLWTRGLSRFGIYITMFLEVLSTLLQVVSGFALLFICFTMSFFIVFTESKDEEFNTPENSFLKVLSMVMGELDYSGLRQHASELPSDMEYIAIGIFIVFCLTMALVVNNLLIGLAVGDIEAVQKNAEIKLLSLQVTQILDARAKMFTGFLRRKCYVSECTELPNRNDCEAEIREQAYKMRNLEKIKRERTNGTVNLASDQTA